LNNRNRNLQTYKAKAKDRAPANSRAQESLLPVESCIVV